MDISNNNTEKQGQQINLRELFTEYIRKWRWFAVSIFVFIAIAAVYIIYTVPKYKVEASILIRQGNNANTGFSPAALFQGMNVNVFSKVIEDEMQILRSSELMKNVINELGLQVNCFEKKSVGYRDIYPRKPVEITLPDNLLSTLKDKIDITVKPAGEKYAVSVNYAGKKKNYELSHFGKSLQTHAGTIEIDKGEDFDEAKPKTYKIEILPMHIATETYCQSITVTSSSRKNSVILISTVAENIDKAKDLITKLLHLYNLDAVVDKNVIAASSKQLIEQRMLLIQSDLTDIESRIENFRKNNKVSDIYLETENYLTNQSEYDRRATDTEMQLGIIDYLLKIINSDKFEMIPDVEFPAGSSSSSKQRETTGSDNISLPSTLIRDYNSSLIERERLIRFESQEKLKIQEIEQRLAQLRSAILISLSSLKEGLDISFKDLKNKNLEYTQKIIQLPEKERELKEISRQHETKQKLYDFLLQKYEESVIALESVFPSAKILNAAETPPSNLESQKVLIAVLIALVLGGLFPVALIYIINLINDKVVNIRQFAQQTNLPVHVAIAQQKKKKNLLLPDKQSAYFLETFRILRTNLLLSSATPDRQVILVTSGIKGEGKTTVAANLALSFAMLGKKTVLVDLDIRQNSVAKYFKLSEKEGITHYLGHSQSDLSGITVQAPAQPYLDIIPAGTVPSTPTELLAGKRLAELFAELRKKYDYMIIDSSPVAVFADTYLLNSQTDCTIYVVRYNYSPANTADLLAKIEDKNKLKNISLVFNGTEDNKRF